MPRVQRLYVTSAEPLRAYSPSQLVGMPHFCDGLHFAARELLETFRRAPRRVRYVADRQRWLLSQAALALHFEHEADPSKPALTPLNLFRFLGDTRAASRNTVNAFLLEMRHYQFGEALDTADRRHRAIKASADTEKLAQHYFDIHLRALDMMDGSSRRELASREPGFVSRAQPPFARRLLRSTDWREPPQSIANFVKTDSGSNILHELAARAPSGAPLSTEPIWIGPVSPSEIANVCLISPSHVVRLFARARRDGLLGWARKSNRGECWISPQLVRDYRYRQAVKFSALSHSARDALQRPGTGEETL